MTFCKLVILSLLMMLLKSVLTFSWQQTVIFREPLECIVSKGTHVQRVIRVYRESLECTESLECIVIIGTNIQRVIRVYRGRAIGGSFTVLHFWNQVFFHFTVFNMSIFHFTAFFYCSHGIFHFNSILKNAHFTFYSNLWFHFPFYSQFLAFFHFTASGMCCFHFTGLVIFPVLQPKFGHFTLYIFKKALFTALRFTYCPPSVIIGTHIQRVIRV